MPNFTYKDDELYHYGVKGMTWKKRKAKKYPKDQYPEYEGPGQTGNDPRSKYLNYRYRKAYDEHMSSWTREDNDHHNYVKERTGKLRENRNRRNEINKKHTKHLTAADVAHEKAVQEARRRREHNARMDDRDRAHAKAVEESRRRRAGLTGTTSSPTRSNPNDPRARFIRRKRNDNGESAEVRKRGEGLGGAPQTRRHGRIMLRRRGRKTLGRPIFLRR